MLVLSRAPARGPERAVVSDDGLAIRVAVYSSDARLVVEVSPMRAIALAKELLDAALRHLAKGS